MRKQRKDHSNGGLRLDTSHRTAAHLSCVYSGRVVGKQEVIQKRGGQPEFATHGSVSRETGNQVHRRVQAWTHDQMGTRDRPASSVLSGPFSHNIFLLVVVDRRNGTWLCLLRWSVERPKTEAVRLGTAVTHDALKRHIAGGESVERIFQHPGIWLDSFSHRGFLDIGRKD